IIYGMVELGEVTAAIAAAVFVVVSGFFASAAFAVAIVHVLPSHFSLLDLFLYGGISSKFNELYTFGVFSSAFKIARPMLLAGVCMVILLCFSLSRRPKNFRKWLRYVFISFYLIS
ncbi:hypothetical protein Tco_0230343, partial [Tanacetum coccineum]